MVWLLFSPEVAHDSMLLLLLECVNLYVITQCSALRVYSGLLYSQPLVHLLYLKFSQIQTLVTFEYQYW